MYVMYIMYNWCYCTNCTFRNPEVTDAPQAYRQCDAAEFCRHH